MDRTARAGEWQGSDVDRFVDDPVEFFDGSGIAMHSLPRDQLVELQRSGMSRRFDQQVERVPMLAKLAGRQGITTVEEFDDLVPVLFEHTVYKSYPIALLERQRFDKLTGWLDKLTVADLSVVDASGVDSIHGWLTLLFEQTGLDVAYSSGTSGTMNFFPWSQRDHEIRWLTYYLQAVSGNGEDPDDREMRTPFHFFCDLQRCKRNYRAELFAQRQDEYVHMRNPVAKTADMMWLAARLRRAAAFGDASQLRVPDYLLARRAELQESQAEIEERGKRWVETLESLQGEKICMMEFAHELTQLAAPRVERGERFSFAPGSVIWVGGGTKGKELPDGWRSTVDTFFGNRTRTLYGMSELSLMAQECDYGRIHISPWIIPYVLEPDTSEILPRTGVQRGRAAFFDLLPRDHWGGLISGDEIEIDWDLHCACGRTTYTLSLDISRLSDKRGGTDKIECAAQPEAYAEAIDFLVRY